MRILLWTESYHPLIGGIQVGVRQYLLALHRLGHQVTVVTTHNYLELPDMMLLDGIAIHRFRFYEALSTNNASLFIGESRRVTKFICEFAPDIVHLMGFAPSGIFYLRSRQQYPTPYILSIRTEDSHKFNPADENTLLYQLMSGADWITTASRLEADRFVTKMPPIASRISCIYHGLPQPKVPIAAPPEQPRLLCIGRFEGQKNFPLAIYAFARIAHLFPDARLIFAGDGWDRPVMEQLVVDFGLSAQVDFLGWIQPEQIPALINQATAVVLPSRWEGLPLTGIQAAQMARPLIATRVSGTPELVTDGETGLLTPSEDVAALATAMHALLSDPKRAAQMGQEAHARINTKFSQAAMIDAYLSLYRRVLATA